MASSDSGPLVPLDQRRIRPGWWRVEGHDVVRYPGVWHVFFEDKLVQTVQSLAKAREWILAEEDRNWKLHQETFG